MMPVYAHTKGANCQDWQPLYDHLERTAQLACMFEKAIDSESSGDSINISYAAGLLHDVGKYSKEFQHRLLDPKCRPVNHSSAGAIVARESYKDDKKGIGTILS